MNITIINGNTDEAISNINGTGNKPLVIVIAVLFSAAALGILLIVLYMAVRTTRKRDLEFKQPVSNRQLKLRKIRLELAFGDLDPKIKRNLVTMNTSSYGGSVCPSGSYHGTSSFVSMPIKYHM